MVRVLRAAAKQRQGEDGNGQRSHGSGFTAARLPLHVKNREPLASCLAGRGGANI